MPIIRTQDGTVTHINVFTVDPHRQAELVESLAETVRAAQGMEGWISASIHRSLDGRKVTNYVQFASAEAARRVTAELFRLGLIQRNTAIGTVAPGEYEVVYSIERP